MRVSDEREFAAEGQLARHMVLQAIALPTCPLHWGAADFANGQDNRFHRLLEHSGVGYVPADLKSHFRVCCSPISDLAVRAPDEAREEISRGDSMKGPASAPAQRCDRRPSPSSIIQVGP
ncbi:hypothetical protein [Streptomyces sp. NPDC004976]